VTVDSAPRLLLFGHPGSGKSSLLGALQRAGDTQGEALGAEVVDPTGRLPKLRDHVYSKSPFEHTHTELVTYEVRLKPWRVRETKPQTFIVHDCDGNAASALLKHPDPITERAVRGLVASAVVQADLLALVVNAGAADDELDDAFDEFLMLLERVHGRKSFEREVGGFPIALILTQCDALFEPGDTAEHWREHVDWRLDHAVKRFAEFLDEQHAGTSLGARASSPAAGPEESGDLQSVATGSRAAGTAADPGSNPQAGTSLGARASSPAAGPEESGDLQSVATGSRAAGAAADPGSNPPTHSIYLPFGSLHLSGFATAVREPGGLEPFGVAECFRSLFAEATKHRERVKRSQRGLRRILWGVACAAWLLFAGAVAVNVWQPTPADPGLAERVHSYQENEPAAAERLAGRNLLRNQKQLASFRSDSGFFALPESLREFVQGRLRESEEYQAYRTKLNATQSPGEARSLEELARVESVLNGELALPSQYTWGETEAAKLRDKWLADVPALRAAESAWQEWYRGLANQALALTITRGFDGEWRDRTLAMEAAALHPPFDEAAAIPGSDSVPQPRGEALTYRTAEEFDRVYQAAKDWEFLRLRLGHQRALADALGLTSETKYRVLEIPPPGTEFDPAERLKALMSDNGVSLANWPLANFPEPARAVLAARLREQIGNGVKHARKLVGERLTADTPDAWRKLGENLNDPTIRDWGRLLHAMRKLDDPRAADPVQDLAAFLRTPEFSLEFTGFELSIPLALRVPALVPAGPLTITVGAESRSFKLSGESTTEGLSAIHRFVAEKATALAFKPGDAIKIELPVRSGDQRFTLTWDDAANRTFPFDKLQREPKLGAEPATGVVLTPAFGSKIPKLPLLLPEMKK
jgi:hypothetical protein